MYDDAKNGPLLVSVGEARRLLSLGNTWLYELIGQEKLIAVKSGRRTLVTTESIRAYVASLPRVGERKDL